MRLTITAAQVQPNDVILRGRLGMESRFVVIAIRQQLFDRTAARLGFIVAPHGDFIGWFTAGSTFTVERN